MDVYIVGLFSVAVFSATAVMAADKKGVDIFSVVVMSLVTALGGGTVRDMMLGRTPVFWVADTNYLWAALLASIFFFFFNKAFRFPGRLLLLMDAVGVAIFNMAAIETTLEAGFSPSVAVVMGVVTGIAGGMVRDLLVDETPLLLRRELYATPLLVGGALYVVMIRWGAPLDISFYAGIFSSLAIRLAAIQYDLYYPAFLMSSGRKGK